MSRLPVPPTRSQWLRLRADLEFLEAGRDLLDQKRELLAEALVNAWRDARARRTALEAALEEAWGLLAEAHGALGAAGLEREALAAEPPPPFRLHERSLMGAALPVVEPEPAPAERLPLRSAPGERGAAADAVAARLRELLPACLELAELEVGCRRLADELARTRRKVNALDVVHLPAHRETIRSIGERLEEREREALFQLKRVQALRGGRPRAGGRP